MSCDKCSEHVRRLSQLESENATLRGERDGAKAALVALEPNSDIDEMLQLGNRVLYDRKRAEAAEAALAKANERAAQCCGQCDKAIAEQDSARANALLEETDTRLTAATELLKRARAHLRHAMECGVGVAGADAPYRKAECTCGASTALSALDAWLEGK